MEESNQTGLNKIADSIETLATGIPTPIRKNFFKAVGQLFTAVVDVPIAHLESKASEIRATSEARVKIIETGGNNISEQLDISEKYVKKAAEKYASKIIKEQLNLDEIVLNATDNLKHKNNSSINHISDKSISDDWLNEFENHARLKSSNEMKIAFGKILSGEISNPGTFSIRTIKLLAQLDNEAATLFQTLCSQSLSIHVGGTNMIDARVITFEGNAGTNSLEKYGLSFANINILQEYGLIIAEHSTSVGYDSCIPNDKNMIGSSLSYRKEHYVLMPIDTTREITSIRGYGIAFTKTGRELLPIIPLKKESGYLKDLNNFFIKKNLKLIKIDPLKMI